MYIAHHVCKCTCNVFFNRQISHHNAFISSHFFSPLIPTLPFTNEIRACAADNGFLLTYNALCAYSLLRAFPVTQQPRYSSTSLSLFNYSNAQISFVFTLYCEYLGLNFLNNGRHTTSLYHWIW